MASKYQKKKARAPVGGLEKRLGRKPTLSEMNIALYGDDNVRGDRNAFNRAKAELERREAEASTKSTEENSLFREGEVAIARHEELTGVNRADWDLIMAARIEACAAITSTRGFDS